MQLFSMQPSFCRQWLEGLRRVAKYVSMLAGFVLLIKYGFPGAVYVLLQVAIYLVALASFLVAILAVVPGIPFAVRLWRSQHEFANFAILVVTFAPFWGTALGMMAGGLLGRLSGEFMVIDLPGP